MRASGAAAWLLVVLHLPASVHAEPATQRTGLGGWTAFGGSLGFFSGTASTTALALALADSGDGSAAAAVGVGSLLLTVGGTALGAWGFRRAAANRTWDRHDGWGAAGVFPGLMGGLMLAGGGFVAATGRSATPALRLSVAGLGAGLGGTIGFFAFRAMSRARGDAGWEHFAFWMSFLACEVVALVTTAGNDQETVGMGLFLVGVGASMGTAFVHLLLL